MKKLFRISATLFTAAIFCFFTTMCTDDDNSKKNDGGVPADGDAAKTLYLAGGCFWGLESFLKALPGVLDTEVGYANGKTANPSYEDVCKKNTGHAETVRVRYDASVLPTETLLDAFFSVVDPTTLNRQGADAGTQYRSGIYFSDECDAGTIRAAVAAQQLAHVGVPVVTEVLPLSNFYSAEEYHQDYLDKNPAGYCHIPRDAAKKFLENLAAAKTPDAGTLIAEKNYRAAGTDELRARLTPEQFAVTQENATERPFANAYFDHFQKGIYVDVTSGEPLFSSEDKFESGCGWPSFAKPIAESVVSEKTDTSHNMVRTEVRSRGGNAHLGHVFEDGPKALGGLRYCVNSAAIRFIPYEKLDEEGYGYLKYLFEKKK